MKLLFFDTEVSTKSNNNIQSIGATDKSEEVVFYGTNLGEFSKVVEKYDVLVGHNVINHDIKHLGREKKVDISLIEKPIIDTLRLSSLFFIKNPYHSLVKDYKLKITDRNNPVEDAKLCNELFDDIETYFESIINPLSRLIIYNLLKNNVEFASFFDFIDSKILVDQDNFTIEKNIKELLQYKICENLDLTELIVKKPLELAYAVRFIETQKSKYINSILPRWIQKELPKVEDIIEYLKEEHCGKCIFCEKEGNLEGHLKSFFGFEKYRDFVGDEGERVSQRDLVKTALDKENLLAILPTGGGKSISFQLPALVEADNHSSLTLVISPLQSLMKDQVDNLQKGNNIINVGQINGQVSLLERKETIEKVKLGGIDLLYLSPESLRTPSIKKMLEGRKIGRVVIDEAHCFSKWGHDFRTDYMFIATFLIDIMGNKIDELKISCYTATAKISVVNDIKDYFKNNLGITFKVFKASIERDNLDYEVITIDNEDDRFNKLIDLFKNRIKNDVTIIFVRETKKAEELSNKLNDHGFNSNFYHGKIKANEKRFIQDEFILGEINIIVATNAFGMGVDKNNVRYVIHYEISSSLENYVQEAGRAGRDGDPSSCIIFYHIEDLDKNFRLIKRSELTKKEIITLLGGIKGSFGYKDIMRISAKELAKKANWISLENLDEYNNNMETKVKAGLFLLEKQDFITRGFNRTRVFITSKEEKNIKRALARIDDADGISEEDKEKTKEILYLIFQENNLTIDDIVDNVLVRKREVAKYTMILKSLGLVDKNNDISCILNIHGVKKNLSDNYLRLYSDIFDYISEDFSEIYQEVGEIYRISQKKLNKKISVRKKRKTLKQEIENLLFYLASEKYIKIKSNTIEFLKPLNTIKKDIKTIFIIAGKVIKFMYKISSSKKQENNKNIYVETGLNDIINHCENELAIKMKFEDLEKILLFLIKHYIIKVDGGLFVYSTLFYIEKSDRLIDSNQELKRFTNDDYDILKKHYDEKIRQVHILGEYIKRLNSNPPSSQFVIDYFTMDYDNFLNLYFNKKKGVISRPMTKDKFETIFKELSYEQTQIINSKGDVIVIAGPGAGKTRTLVHKVASLVLMEDVKPSQFLMLTFSRSAKFEIKERIVKLIGNEAYGLDIETYHSYAFKNLGFEGNIENKKIISECTESILENENELPYSVILIDEFQDIDHEQFELVKAIVKKSSGDQKIRVIAVGDDDQNIYTFRGSNVKYIREFKETFKAESFYLTTNYRSSEKIVDLSQSFIKKGTNRTKNKVKLVAYKEGNLLSDFDNLSKTITYKGEGYTKDIVSIIDMLGSKDDIGILCFTNEKVLEIKNLLDKEGLESDILLGKATHKLHHIIEVKEFIDSLEEDTFDRDYLVVKYKKLREKYNNNKNIKKLGVFLKKYIATNKKYFLHTFKDFVYGSEENDVLENKTIKISTLHQTKGREFESVIILFDEDYISKIDEEQRRLIYVGLTRAKKNLIVVGHINDFYFNELVAIIGDNEEKEFHYKGKKELELLFGLDKVNIGWNKDKKIYKICGLSDNLNIKPLKYGPGFEKNGKIIQVLSRDGIDNYLNKFLNKGYKMKKAKVFQRLVYTDDTGKEIIVYLLTINLSK